MTASKLVKLNSISSSEVSTASTPLPSAASRLSRLKWITLGILFFVNLLNYMDRLTVAAILEDLSQHICKNDEGGKCSESRQGLLQTAFVVVYMAIAPVFGYLGDRHSRKWLMAGGVVVWGVVSLISTFMETYWPFLVFRASIAIGESAFSTIAPTVLGDLFTDEIRSLVLGLFYLAIPLGSGLGYAVGGGVASATGAWYWGLRVTPGLNIVTAIVIVLAMYDPPRGESDGTTMVAKTSWWEDLKYIFRVKSFSLNVAGFTCVTFMAGALAFWAPVFMEKALMIYEHTNGEGTSPVPPKNVTLVLGIILATSGITGVLSGMLLSRYLRPRYPRIDPLICGGSLFMCIPLLLAGLFLSSIHPVPAFVLLFLGQIFLNMNWSVAVDMTIYVILPTRRSTAEAFHLMASHALGEAGSPYLIGVISQNLKSTDSTCEGDICDTLKDFYALQRAMLLAFAILLVGSILFLIAAVWVDKDKKAVDRTIAMDSQEEDSQEEDSQEEDSQTSISSQINKKCSL